MGNICVATNGATHFLCVASAAHFLYFQERRKRWKDHRPIGVRKLRLSPTNRILQTDRRVNDPFFLEINVFDGQYRTAVQNDA